jgi:hypothetical protein
METKYPQEKYTFEQVWQALMENREQIKKLSANVDKNAIDIARTTANIDKNAIDIANTTANIDKNALAIKETNKQIGGIANSNGAMAQEAIFNALKQDLTFAGIKFDDATPQVPVLEGFKTVADIDALMINCDTLALIEIKYKVDTKDVKKLVFDTVNKFKENFPKYSNYKIILGIGGMSFEDDAINEATEYGVGVIKVVGDKVEYHTEGIKIYQ